MAAVSMKLALVVVFVVVVVVQYGSEATISCGTVESKLAPCLNYLRGKGVLTETCCRGVSSLNKLASTKPDRQQVCKCLKQLITSISGINPTIAEGLPGKCGVNIPYKISTSTNCTTIN